MILRRDATWLSAELLPELVSGRIEGVLGAAPPGATRGKLPVAAPEPETLGEGKQLAFCPLEREWGKAGSEGSPLLVCVCGGFFVHWHAVVNIESLDRSLFLRTDAWRN